MPAVRASGLVKRFETTCALGGVDLVVEDLTLPQQRELGRPVPPGSSLNIVPSRTRRGSTPRGPGDWVCTMTVFIPQPGAQPFQQTPSPTT